MVKKPLIPVYFAPEVRVSEFPVTPARVFCASLEFSTSLDEMEESEYTWEI